MGKNKSPNDNRSNSKNPNNSASKAARDNRSNQLNPNNPRSQGSSNHNRSNINNPNNPAYYAAKDNRANQLNQNNPQFQGASSKKVIPSRTSKNNRTKKIIPNSRSQRTLSKKVSVFNEVINKKIRPLSPPNPITKDTLRKFMMNLKAARRIQSHADRFGLIQKFKARAQRAAAKNKKRK